MINILWTFKKCKVQNDFAQKSKACIFHLNFFFLANLYSKDVGPWKLKWAPKFQNLGAHLAPKIFNKVSPLLMTLTFLLDDMEISPGSTPTSSRPPSCVGTPLMATTPASLTTPSISMATSIGPGQAQSTLISTLPQLINQLGGGQNNQELTQKGISGGKADYSI